MDQLVSEASSTTSTTDVTSSDGLRVLSFDTFQHAAQPRLESSRTVRCCCELVAAHATGACRRLLCHAGSIAVQLAAGAGATERHRERARDRLRRRTWTVLRDGSSQQWIRLRNARGKFLRIKADGHMDGNGEGGVHCEFKLEKHAGGHVTLQSIHNQSWHVGVNDRGGPRDPHMTGEGAL